jgi:homoserine dehydrogenase
LVEQGQTFTDAIASAQAQGYAEADPSADIEGKDDMLKVIVLANRLWALIFRRQMCRVKVLAT